ncbi:MAG: PulJ/GspJ family protein [Pseudobdellovibrionaceae bacterium]
MFSNNKISALKSGKGFTLIEVMIGTAIVSVVGLGIASVMNDMAKSQKNVREKSSIQEAVNSINMVLAKNDGCKDAIKGPGGNPITESAFAASTASSPLILSSVDIPTVAGGSSIIKTGQPLPGTPSVIIDSIKLINSGALRNGQNNPSTLIQQDSAGNPITFKLYVGTIEVNFGKNPAFSNASMGPAKIVRTFRTTVGFAQQASASFGVAAGQLGLCNSDSSVSQECQSMFGGVFDPANSSPQCHIPKIASEVGFSINTSASSSGLGTTQLNITPAGDITLGSGSTAPFFVKSGGGVGIGTTSPASALDVQGNIAASQTVTAANVVAAQSVTAQSVAATSANIGGCQLSGGSINCPNSISTGGGTTTVINSTTLASTSPVDMELIKQQVCASLDGTYNAGTGKCTLSPTINTITIGGGGGGGGGGGTGGGGGGNTVVSNTTTLPDGSTIASKITPTCDAACVVQAFFARNSTGDTVANANAWMASVGQTAYTTYANAYSMNQTLGAGGVAQNTLATGSALGYSQSALDHWTIDTYNQYNTLPTTASNSGADLYQSTVTGYNTAQATFGTAAVDNFIATNGAATANAAALIVNNASNYNATASQVSNAINEATSKYSATDIANWFASGKTLADAVQAGLISGQ